MLVLWCIDSLNAYLHGCQRYVSGSTKCTELLSYLAPAGGGFDHGARPNMGHAICARIIDIQLLADHRVGCCGFFEAERKIENPYLSSRRRTVVGPRTAVCR